jgi:parallel beta-helix repeat protein
MYDSDNNTILKNNLIENDDGIRILRSSNNSIISNFIIGNDDGIYLVEATNNTIALNTVLNSNYSITISDSRWNHIYMNNVINGKKRQVSSFDTSSYENIWNDTNGKGNYWDDYTGLDDGSNSRIAGDGVGDTEIPHPSTNKGNGYYHLDNYPLIYQILNFTYLYNGWNLVSVPLIQSDTTFNHVLSSLHDTYEAVQWFDVTDSADYWKHNHISKPSPLNDLTNINQNMGFWIHITNPGGVLFEYPGTAPTTNQTISLHPGWNMVGYPSLSNYNRTVGLNNLEFGTDVDAIQWYNAATKTWHFMGPDDSFVPGRGYWMHSKVDASWEVPL